MFFLKIFSRKKNIYFNYDWIEMIYSESPEDYSKEAPSLVLYLTDSDKKKISKTIDELHNSLVPLFKFWKSNPYANKILQDEPTKLYKSYAEFNIVEWMFLVKMLRKKGVEESIIEVLFYIIEKSFNSLGKHIFSVDNFKNFENALKARIKIYPEILNYFLNPRENEVESYSNLFTLIIEEPMKKEIDLEGLHLMNFGDLDRMHSSMFFIKIFSQTLSKFNQSTKNIW